MSSLLVFMGIFPEVQEQVYQEQVEIFGDDLHRDPDVSDLDKMEILTRVIKETMRHVSPGIIFKKNSEDLVLGETCLFYKLKKVFHQLCFEETTGF